MHEKDLNLELGDIVRPTRAHVGRQRNAQKGVAPRSAAAQFGVARWRRCANTGQSPGCQI